jgi:predicted lipoprotein with Yx(FWY)xxD motif
MRTFVATLSAAAFVAALAAPVFAKTETVKGELVDQNCYTKDHKNMGESHKECAETCAKRGQPVALVTADGKVYTVTGDFAANSNAKLVAHMAHQVEVTGDVSEKDGKMTIAVTDVKMAKK